jgi:hypothetical protein
LAVRPPQCRCLEALAEMKVKPVSPPGMVKTSARLTPAAAEGPLLRSVTV